MKSKLNCRNKIIPLNIWASAGIVKWAKSELDEIDRMTR